MNLEVNSEAGKWLELACISFIVGVFHICGSELLRAINIELIYYYYFD
jgi:hypothetical protein